MRCSFGYLLRGVASLLCATAVHTAHAIDVGVGNPPQKIDDGQMRVGARTLQLPAGSWTLVAKRQDHMSDRHGMNKETRSQTFTAYAMNASDASMRAGVVLKMLLDSHPVTKWVDEPCQVKDPLYRDDFNSSYGQSQCLLIFKRKTHLTSSGDAFYAQAKEWLRENNVANPGPVYEIQYFRFAANEYGWVRVFLPQSLVSSESAVVDYAKQLPGNLKDFFERRTTSATLPALPIRAEKL